MRLISMCQDESAEKAGLLLDRCSFEPQAAVMVLKDEGRVAVNNDYTIRWDRKVTFKFFQERRIDRQLAEAIFYPSPSFDKYYKVSVRIIELDPTTKSVVARDISTRVTAAHIDQLNLRIKSGSLLEVSYSINFPYNEKIPDWRFQSQYPCEVAAVSLEVPGPVDLEESILGSYEPEINRSTEAIKRFRLNNRSDSMKVTESLYQFNQLPSIMQEPFSDNSPNQQARMHLQVLSVIKGTDTLTNFAKEQVEKIIESLSSRPDFLLRLAPPLDIKADYDRRIRSISDPEEKVARIYDLVRRHITWTAIDSMFASHTLSKVWADKKGNSTEMNLVLVKLLQVYGFKAAPLIVSTRSNGKIDTNEVALSDFNRTVAYVNFGRKHIVLDATGKYCDYPMLTSCILNTRGLLISPDPGHWIDIKDTGGFYKNAVTLLGHLLGDTSFFTNVYINSTGYAKPEHVELLEVDSLRGLRKYFERGNKKIQLKHFIAANEWVDTLPLAQEFDIKVPLVKTDNLDGVVPTWFSVPDTLFAIAEGRKSDINFGYRQEYDLVSEFTFPENYEIYLMPKDVTITAVNGTVRFVREYHSAGTNFSIRQSFFIDRSYFNMQESVELAKFLKKVANLNAQQVMLKKNY